MKAYTTDSRDVQEEQRTVTEKVAVTRKKAEKKKESGETLKVSTSGLSVSMTEEEKVEV